MHSGTENLTEKLDLKNKLLLIMEYTKYKYTTTKKNYIHYFHQFKEEPNMNEPLILCGFCGEIDGLTSMNLLY